MKLRYEEFGQIYKEYKFAYCLHAESWSVDLKALKEKVRKE